MQELPHVYEAYVVAARQYARNGRFEEAAQVLERALQLEERPTGHLMLSDVFKRLGRTDDALRHARRAAELGAAASRF